MRRFYKTNANFIKIVYSAKIEGTKFVLFFYKKVRLILVKRRFSALLLSFANYNLRLTFFIAYGIIGK